MFSVAPESSIKYWLNGLPEALNPTKNLDLPSENGERDVL